MSGPATDHRMRIVCDDVERYDDDDDDRELNC